MHDNSPQLVHMKSIVSKPAQLYTSYHDNSYFLILKVVILGWSLHIYCYLISKLYKKY